MALGRKLRSHKGVGPKRTSGVVSSSNGRSHSNPKKRHGSSSNAGRRSQRSLRKGARQQACRRCKESERTNPYEYGTGGFSSACIGPDGGDNPQQLRQGYEDHSHDCQIASPRGDTDPGGCPPPASNRPNQNCGRPYNEAEPNNDE